LLNPEENKWSLTGEVVTSFLNNLEIRVRILLLAVKCSNDLHIVTRTLLYSQPHAG
jgi:hypothetical protein